MNELKFKNWLKKPSNCLIMGIVNTTPDSFSDGGKYNSANKAIDRAYHLLENGADIIDIGGESSRPGAKPVSPAEEIKRISPLLTELAKNTDSTISIDTYKSSTAIYALDNGAHLINDISGMTHDKKMVNIVSMHKAPIVIMHMKGTPKTMQKSPFYENVISDVCNFFQERLNIFKEHGISAEQVAFDPGIGFGKSLNHNIELMSQLNKFKVFQRPVLIGASRKSFIEKLIGTPVEARLPASLTCAAWAIMQGSQIIRAHEVAETTQAARMAEALIENNNGTVA